MRDTNKKVNIKITTVQNDETNVWESEGIMKKDNDTFIVEYPDYASNTVTQNRMN